jgi:YegS/Rv2252/BmrU family lipid kinase
MRGVKESTSPTVQLNTVIDDKDESGENLPRPITCIINTHSRKGRENFDDAVAELRKAGIPLSKAHAVGDKSETMKLLKNEIAAGANLVIIGGGDGTLSDCADHLAGTQVAMGVLPLGTGNTLARSLGIPLDLAGAAQTLATGHITTMDVGRVNGQAFLNSVTLGLSSEIAHALDGNIKKKLGVFSWPIIGCKVFLRHRALVLRVQSAERSYRVRTHQLVVANGRYIAGPVAASPDAAINDHNLDVFVLGGQHKRSLLRTGLRWLRGLHTKSPEAKFFQTRSVRVESLRGPVKADVDGEINDQTPLEITIEPGALRVVVPNDFNAQTV